MPVFPNLAKTLTPDGPNQLWVSDITDVPLIVGFVHVAVVLDAWSRLEDQPMAGRVLADDEVALDPASSGVPTPYVAG